MGRSKSSQADSGSEAVLLYARPSHLNNRAPRDEVTRIHTRPYKETIWCDHIRTNQMTMTVDRRVARCWQKCSRCNTSRRPAACNNFVPKTRPSAGDDCHRTRQPHESQVSISAPKRLRNGPRLFQSHSQTDSSINVCTLLLDDTQT